MNWNIPFINISMQASQTADGEPVQIFVPKNVILKVKKSK